MKRQDAIRVISSGLRQYSINNQIKNINSVFGQVAEEVADELCTSNAELNGYLQKVSWKRFLIELRKWYN